MTGPAGGARRRSTCCGSETSVRGQSPPWPLSTWPTGGNAEGFHGRHASRPAWADVFSSLLDRSAAGGPGAGEADRGGDLLVKELGGEAVEDDLARGIEGGRRQVSRESNR